MMRTAALFTLLAAAAAPAAAKSVSATPHDSYSSSVGVLGCKINTNRVAYWPEAVDCDKICVKVTHGGRSVHLLRVDKSTGAHDISYDAWNYLQTGRSAFSKPITGGAVDMEYEEIDASECADLIYTEGSKLPLSASNSVEFLAHCVAQNGSWVSANHVLYNIADSLCEHGYNETCTLNLANGNQANCTHTLGATVALTGSEVYNIQYKTGDVVQASTGTVVTSRTRLIASNSTTSSSNGSSTRSSAPVSGAVGVVRVAPTSVVLVSGAAVAAVLGLF